MARITSLTRAPAINEIDTRDADSPALRIDGGGRPETASILSAEELRKRADAIRFANASIGLEGFKVSAEAQARADQFIAGETDLATFIQDR